MHKVEIEKREASMDGRPYRVAFVAVDAGTGIVKSEALKTYEDIALVMDATEEFLITGVVP